MSIKNWITGARVRTLPLAVAPIVLGSASADLVERYYFRLVSTTPMTIRTAFAAPMPIEWDRFGSPVLVWYVRRR